MSARAGRPDILASPRPGDHVLHLHTDPSGLAASVGYFIGEGLRRGEGALVIARPAHRDAIERRLLADGLAPGDLCRRGVLALLDAAECLDRFAVDGTPDPARFRAVIGGVIEAVRARGPGRVRAFGEMVDLLRHRSLDAALRLESLWDQQLAEGGIALMCGYGLDHLDRRVHRDVLPRLARAHSHFVPAEDGDRLARAVEQAYADVFGDGGDAEVLRRLLLDRYAGSAAMPEPAAALLAARELLPATADLLVDRVGEHYRR